MFAIDDIMEFRRESRETATQIAEDAKRAAIREANAAQNHALFEAERDYWRRMLAKSNTDEEYEHALRELEALDALSAPTESPRKT